MKMKVLFPIPSFARMLTAGLMAASLAGLQADELQKVWDIPTGVVDYVTTGNLERGIAINPATGNVILVHRQSGAIAEVIVLSGTDGSEIRRLDMTGVEGGTFSLSQIKVADDGKIYGANLITSTTSANLKVYRWESETDANPPTLVFDADPSGKNEDGTPVNSQRWGDNMDLRGSGTETQILFGAGGSAAANSVAALLTTTDGINFTSKLISNALSAGATGIAFGEGNRLWSKRNTVVLRHVAFDPATGVGTLIQSYPVNTTFPTGIGPIAVSATEKLLAGVDIGTHTLRIYDISELTAPAFSGSVAFPAPVTNNGNGAGAADWHGNLIAAVDTNNGLVLYRYVRTITPPAIVTPPGNLTILDGGYATLSVGATGTKPLTYIWRKGDQVLGQFTGSSITFTDVTPDVAGTYTVTVKNSAGEAESVSQVTIAPSVRTQRATHDWALRAGDRAYVTDANLERGVAVNKVTRKVLFVSRTADVNVHIVDLETGADLGKLNAPATENGEPLVAGSNPAGFRLNMVDVADDGAVYAANLDTAGATYTIYRWANDDATTVPTVAWYGDPGAGQRYGDTFTVRGSGIDTQILAGSRTGTGVALFTTVDGVNFTATYLDVADATGGNFGLGIAFGEGNTFYGKGGGSANPLTLVSFDLSTGTARVVKTFPEIGTAFGPIAVDPQKKLLAAVATGETPDNVRLYDISNAETGPVLIDQDFFPTDLNNTNGTGSADFGLDHLLAIDTNNGVLALELNDEPTTGVAAELINDMLMPNQIMFTVKGTPNKPYKIQWSSTLTPNSWSDLQTVTLDGTGMADVVYATAETFRFYRAVAQ